MNLLKSLCLVLLLALTASADDSWMLFQEGDVAEIHLSLPEDALDWMFAHTSLDSLHLGSMSYHSALIDTVIQNVGVRLRGNTSRDADKKSFKISFNDYEAGREFFDVDKLNLNGEHNDPTVSRAWLNWRLWQQTDVPASRAAHVALWINDLYMGVYANIEHVDDEFLWKHFDDDSGNLWKCLWPADLTYQGPDGDDYKYSSGGHRTYDLKTNEDADDYSQLARLIRVLNQTSVGALPDSLESLLDVDGVLSYFAFDVLAASWDDYWFLKNNFYLYHNPSEDRFTLIPYDYDNSYGIDWFNIDWSTRHPMEWGSSEDRPLARLLLVHEWHNLYQHFLLLYNERLFNPDNWASAAAAEALLIRSDVAADSFYSLDYGFSLYDFDNAWVMDDYQNQHVKYSVREYVDRRRGTIPQQQDWMSDAGPVVYDWQLEQDDSLRITAAVWCHGGLDSVYAVLDDAEGSRQFALSYDPVEETFIPAEADRWCVTLPLPEGATRLCLRAVSSTGVCRYPLNHDIQLEQTSSSPLRLNELLADNESVNSDEAGDFDDWLELTNTSAQTVSLNGLYLTDDEDEPLQWALPSGLSLPAGGLLLIWCDDENQGELHANFRLSAGGEFLGLADAEGWIDSVEFGEQDEDIAWGRLPDGIGDWQFVSPTPGEENEALAVNAAEPTAFSLQARPNPFNGSLLLHFELPVAGDTQLRIVDLLGREILTRTLGHLSAGSHDWSWQGENQDGHQVASGCYFVVLKSGAVTQLRAVTLVR